MIDREGGLEAVRCHAAGEVDAACVVDQHIEPRQGVELRREAPHLSEGRKVRLQEAHFAVAGGRTHRLHRGLPFGRVPTVHQHPVSQGGKRPSRREPDAIGRTRNQYGQHESSRFSANLRQDTSLGFRHAPRSCLKPSTA
jgi:hypothetical protein